MCVYIYIYIIYMSISVFRMTTTLIAWCSEWADRVGSKLSPSTTLALAGTGGCLVVGVAVHQLSKRRRRNKLVEKVKRKQKQCLQSFNRVRENLLRNGVGTGMINGIRTSMRY
jgi:hypothetical protein